MAQDQLALLLEILDLLMLKRFFEVLSQEGSLTGRKLFRGKIVHGLVVFFAHILGNVFVRARHESVNDNVITYLYPCIKHNPKS